MAEMLEKEKTGTEDEVWPEQLARQSIKKGRTGKERFFGVRPGQELSLVLRSQMPIRLPNEKAE